MRVRVSRVVLVGLPGAGKTTVGRLLAERLGWRFLDPDEDIRRETGLDIAAIFRTRGEAAFRELEQRAVVRALEEERVVVAPGGGWLPQPGAWESVPEGTALVWLQVSVSEASERLARDDIERPLLAQEDMVSRLGRLEGERTLAYARAGIAVSTEGSTPAAVVDEIVDRLVSEYGIDGRA